MSEEEKVEISNEQKLAATYKRLLITILFSCIGWSIFVYAFNYAFNPFLMLLGGAVVSAPILWIMARGGGLKDAFHTDEYEVVTTYSDGSKKSDGGSESFLMGCIVKIFMAFFVVFLGCLITIGLLVWLIIRYIILYGKVSEKPSFIKSGFLLMLIGLAVFIGSGMVIGAMQKSSVEKSQTTEVSMSYYMRGEC